MFETVTPDCVSEVRVRTINNNDIYYLLYFIYVLQIKERVVQAATGCVTKPVQNSSLNNVTGGHSPTTPLFPSCNKQHAEVPWDYRALDNLQFPQNNIIAIPIGSQETLLLYDLIYCLTGMRGSYITPIECMTSARNSCIKFMISEQIHNSLRDIAQEMLPLASYYTCIERFIQNASLTECGQVLQAFSEALSSLIHDYYVSLLYKN